jgi:Xaa-Pro aminopeptidase
MKYQPLDPALFKHNRERFAKAMQPNTMAIFNSNDLMPRTGDAFYKFRQNSDLFYLSGLDQEEVVLVLFPDCIKAAYREVVFTKKSNEHIAIWEGHKYTKEEVTTVSGITTVFWLENLDTILNEMLILAEAVYLNGNDNDRFQSPVPYKDLRFANELRQKYPAHTFLRSQPILKQLRMIKSNYEIPILQHAINLTEKTFRRVLQFTRAGVMEYEVEAEITHEFLRNAATGHGYEPIIASGKNACVLHYVENNQMCKAGDLLLMDFGAEYANYNADMTRTIPVNGRFTDRQKAVYQAVLNVIKAATNMLRPSVLMEEYQKEVGKIMESELIGLGLLDKTDVKNQSKEHPLYKKYFMHGTSHHLGLDVHDLGNRYLPIQSGMVFTCEPGIYIREEGLGVRLENNILVTDTEPIDMMWSIPIEIEDIEDCMNE